MSWKFLVTWAEGQTALALERERNHATVEALRRLPPGCELMEYERGGRLRVVRYPGRPGAEEIEEPSPREINR